MAKVSGIAESLDGRLKAAVRAHGLEINALAGRTLAEGILRHWHHGLGPSPIELKGGMLFDQRARPTSDADITAIRRYLPHETHRGLLIIRALLQAEGMDIDFLSDNAQPIDVGHGDPVERWVVRGSVGGVRARTQIDITIGRGSDAFSSATEVTEIPSFVPRVPALTIACQPIEAAYAEKILAVICQPTTDMRVKYLADVNDDRLWEGVEVGQVVAELDRVCRHRGIDPSALPETLDVTDYERLRSNWSKLSRPGMTPMSFDEAIAAADDIWQDVQYSMSMRPLRTYAPARRVGGMR
ncbi:nucleotidyl transferase AbiEii/AbiGii toxin family protein [Shinella sp. H4-D48]|uniref:nucleotidyl transferase AbiEii/AbiGii toxin family protein n=1 Tax=Shinella sp. H4-D48 TaxID=2925841 RepID=UPI001F52D95D|nr:nucleotidyl transferase AbiEii/AbiGii toxin family protein [Shinella sp. H4-D48]UNK37713.1 nucleotidyl transferase AbiEii/AbiGii toxin family protein [Shinella sp. H4-D48]